MNYLTAVAAFVWIALTGQVWFRRWFNPCAVFALSWLVAIALYRYRESTGFYYPLTEETLFHLTILPVGFLAGCWLSRLLVGRGRRELDAYEDVLPKGTIPVLLLVGGGSLALLVVGWALGVFVAPSAAVIDRAAGDRYGLSSAPLPNLLANIAVPCLALAVALGALGVRRWGERVPTSRDSMLFLVSFALLVSMGAFTANRIQTLMALTLTLVAWRMPMSNRTGPRPAAHWSSALLGLVVVLAGAYTYVYITRWRAGSYGIHEAAFLDTNYSGALGYYQALLSQERVAATWDLRLFCYALSYVISTLLPGSGRLLLRTPIPYGGEKFRNRLIGPSQYYNAFTTMMLSGYSFGGTWGVVLFAMVLGGWSTGTYLRFAERDWQESAVGVLLVSSLVWGPMCWPGDTNLLAGPIALLYLWRAMGFIRRSLLRDRSTASSGMPWKSNLSYRDVLP